jgi:acetyl esterase/lipase
MLQLALAAAATVSLTLPAAAEDPPAKPDVTRPPAKDALAPVWPAPADKLALDEAQTALLRRLVRERARTVRPQDLARLPADGKVLSPLRPSPGAAKPDGTGRQSSQSAGRPTHFRQGPDPGLPRLEEGYHARVPVLAPGRLDWTILVSAESLDPEPIRAMPDYDSTKQSYELFIPSGYKPEQEYPLILYVSPGDGDGWSHWRQLCQSRGAFLVAPHNAGNDGGVERPMRFRVVLDALDDVRRRFHIDPDRTYISGISGGGNVASRIAFALPELFGGAMPIVGAWGLRRQPSLRLRAAERLSVGVLTGEDDFNRPEMELEFFPVIRENGTRSVLRVYPGMGHGCPTPEQLEEVYDWLEEGLPARRKLAARYPASRLAGPLTPDEWSAALLVEAGERLQEPDGLAAGLFEIQGVVTRWKGTRAAAFAAELLRDFDATSAVPWKDIYNAEMLRFAELQARYYDKGMVPPPPRGYSVSRSLRYRLGVNLWTEVLELAPPGSDFAGKVRDHIEELKRREKEEPPEFAGQSAAGRSGSKPTSVTQIPGILPIALGVVLLGVAAALAWFRRAGKTVAIGEGDRRPGS